MRQDSGGLAVLVAEQQCADIFFLLIYFLSLLADTLHICYGKTKVRSKNRK